MRLIGRPLSALLLVSALAIGVVTPDTGCRRRSDERSAKASKTKTHTKKGARATEAGRGKLSPRLASIEPQAKPPQGVSEAELKKMPHLKVLLESLYKVHRRYVDPQQLDPTKMFIKGLREIQEDVAAVQVRFIPPQSENPQMGVVQVGQAKLPFSLVGLKTHEEIYTYFRWALGFIRKNLKKIGEFSEEEASELEYTAINGFLNTLDPYSVLLPPKSYGEMKIRTTGSFGGIGIVISIRDGALTVISPIDGTPAARAGIQPSDRIVRIGAESTVNMGLHEAVTRLRGKVDTKVTFWVERDGLPAPKKYTLTRARIEIHSVTSKKLKGDVGYLRLNRFSENTRSELEEQVKKLTRRGCTSMILDMTNNPGGLLSQAISIASAFLDKGTIVVTEGARGVRVDTKKAKSDDTIWRGPLVVLVNRGSASAAEIVAGALKYLGRAVVIGERTFGKGTVQVLMKNADRSALKLTVARYLIRGDVPIQTVGIVPDILTVPVAVRKKWVRFNTLQKRSGEERLREHLSPGRKVYVPKPRWTLKYLRKKRSKKQMSAQGDMGADTTKVDLARDLLIRHKGTRKEMLAECGPFLAEHTATQQRRIVKAVKQMGVDWRPPPVEAKVQPPALAVQLRSNEKNDTVTAGQKIKLTMTVENIGQTPVWQVRAMLKAPAYYLNGQEFIFGHLEPGKKRAWTIEVEVPAHEWPQVQPIRTELYALDEKVKTVRGTGSTPKNPFLLTIKSLPHPLLVLDYNLVELDGNGNGLLEPTEKGGVDCKVSNRGPGSAENVIVSLVNKTGKWLYLKKGRAVIKKLQAGKQRNTRLTFRLQKENPKPKLDVELGVYESEVRTGFEKRLRLPLAHKATSLKGHLEPPRIHLQPTKLITQDAQLVLSGKVTHPTQLKDYYIFVTNQSRDEKKETYRRKTHYRTARDTTTQTLAIAATVNLPLGLNTIVIFARSTKDLTGYRLVHVLRLPPDATMSIPQTKAAPQPKARRAP